ncbi:MAG: CD0415/CD1112 family protein, partial [Oscillospiraceae bacterium]|nr:CD0415/CD1112 family protein [Oscillospiraceae bacterium]
PIAGMILTFVLCYELIQVIIEKNNMHEFEVFNLYKWIFKTFCAVYILTHTFDIVLFVFALAQNVINNSAGIIADTLDMNADAALANLEAMLQTMGVFELMGLWLETFLINICLTILTICIFIIIFGRMLEIYLTISVAPIPLSTMVNREWGQMGNNYLKGLFALAFQGFLIMVCVAIYAALVADIPMAGSVHGAIWGTVGYTVLLCFALFKTGSLSKQLFS